MIKIIASALALALLGSPTPDSGDSLQSWVTVGVPIPGIEVTITPLPVSGLVLAETPAGIPAESSFNYSLAYLIEDLGSGLGSDGVQLLRKDGAGNETLGPARVVGTSGFGVPAEIDAQAYSGMGLDFLDLAGGLVIGWSLEAE